MKIINEIQIKDIPYNEFENEIKEMLKSVIMDYGSDIRQEIFEHSYKRITYLVSKKYKGFLMGEVRYIFDAMIEHIKGKISVSSIMQLFSKYYDEKIEKQRFQIEQQDLNYEKNIVNCMKSPLGKAIIYKIQMVERGDLEIKDWEKIPLKKIADEIQSGKINFIYKRPKI